MTFLMRLSQPAFSSFAAAEALALGVAAQALPGIPLPPRDIAAPHHGLSTPVSGPDFPGLCGAFGGGLPSFGGGGGRFWSRGSTGQSLWEAVILAAQ